MEELLCTPCPVSNCKNSRKDVHIYWKHYNCGGRTKIRYQDITISCDKCYCRRILFDWLFSCGQHDFTPGSAQGWLFALGIMGQQQGNLNQIKKAIRKIGEMI